MRVEWDKLDERLYHQGLDRGTLYIDGLDPVPWNGLTGVDEGGTPTTSVLYRDGVIYYVDAEETDFSARVTALSYPPEFSGCMGMPRAADGLIIDSQRPERFSFNYRTLIGSGARGDLFGYQIHLVYNAVATISARSRRTMGSSTSPIEFGWDIECVPVRLAGFRPTAHYIIDTRGMSASVIQELEDILYGTDLVAGRMPTPTELFDLMNFGPEMIFTLHSDGYYTVSGASENLYSTGPNSFMMKNVNANETEPGVWEISDGGDTTVIIE